MSNQLGEGWGDWLAGAVKWVVIGAVGLLAAGIAIGFWLAS